MFYRNFGKMLLAASVAMCAHATTMAGTVENQYENKTTFDLTAPNSNWTQADGVWNLTQGDFVLTVSLPAGSETSDINSLYSGGALVLPQNATFTVASTSGYNLNMIAESIYLNNDDKRLTTAQNWAQGGLGTLTVAEGTARQAVAGWGCDYSEYGDQNNVLIVNTPSAKFDFNGNWSTTLGLRSISVRSCQVNSALVDMYTTQRGFDWIIDDDMVIVRYDDVHGVLYTRSLHDSNTWKQAGPSEGQTVYDNASNFTNYDWLAVILPASLKEAFEKEYAGNRAIDQVIKRNAIKGLYVDFATGVSAGGDQGASYLNPTILLDESVDITDFLNEDMVAQPTKRNTYYPVSFVEQDEVYFVAPKRNEVCNVKYAHFDWWVLTNVKYNFKDHDLFGRVRINNFNELMQNGLAVDQSFRTIYELNDVLVEMAFYNPEVSYEWEEAKYWNGSENIDIFRPRNSDTQTRFLFPEAYQDVEYYDIYGHTLTINGKMSSTPQKGDVTGVADVAADAAVASVTYVNAAGQQASEPWQGLNIVVTTRTSGARDVKKVIL